MDWRAFRRAQKSDNAGQPVAVKPSPLMLVKLFSPSKEVNDFKTVKVGRGSADDFVEVEAVTFRLPPMLCRFSSPSKEVSASSADAERAEAG